HAELPSQIVPAELHVVFGDDDRPEEVATPSTPPVTGFGTSAANADAAFSASTPTEFDAVMAELPLADWWVKSSGSRNSVSDTLHSAVAVPASRGGATRNRPEADRSGILN
ncbi:MAG: hypothetical protein KDB01_17020, partial [Planctomycetaceae bacterium]|nr:hypothetical protein [Planctomycetaceae bacterium]